MKFSLQPIPEIRRNQTFPALRRSHQWLRASSRPCCDVWSCRGSRNGVVRMRRPAIAIAVPVQLLTGPVHELAAARAVTPAELAGHRIWMPGIVTGTVYPHSLIWRSDNSHPALTTLRNYLGSTQPDHRDAGMWTPTWAQRSIPPRQPSNNVISRNSYVGHALAKGGGSDRPQRSVTPDATH